MLHYTWFSYNVSIAIIRCLSSLPMEDKRDGMDIYNTWNYLLTIWFSPADNGIEKDNFSRLF